VAGVFHKIISRLARESEYFVKNSDQLLRSVNVKSLEILVSLDVFSLLSGIKSIAMTLPERCVLQVETIMDFL
jgi:hypothetical protein